MECWFEQFIEEIAKGLTSKVCKVLERGGPDAVKDAKRGSYEVLVFVLAHLDADAALYKKGIPSKFRARLNKAFGENASLDRIRWAMLGKAKWHVFTPNCKFGMRSARKNRSSRRFPRMKRICMARMRLSSRRMMRLSISRMIREHQASSKTHSTPMTSSNSSCRSLGRMTRHSWHACVSQRLRRRACLRRFFLPAGGQVDMSSRRLR